MLHGDRVCGHKRKATYVTFVCIDTNLLVCVWLCFLCLLITPTVLKHQFSTILDATEDFSSQHLLGSGTFGDVYVGCIGGNRFAIKKMYKVRFPYMIFQCSDKDNFIALHFGTIVFQF